MSVTTTADEKIQSARDHIAAATKDLSEVIVDKVWGYDEFNEAFKAKLRQVFNDLLELAEKF